MNPNEAPARLRHFRYKNAAKMIDCCAFGFTVRVRYGEGDDAARPNWHLARP